MLCKKPWKKRTCVLTLLLGIISFAFGLTGLLTGLAEGRAVNRLLCMISGFGFGIMLVAAFMRLRSRVVSKERLEREEIEREDERNIAISRAAGLTAFYAAGGLLAVLAFVFVGLDDSAPSMICVGGIYLLAAVYLAARRVYAKKM